MRESFHSIKRLEECEVFTVELRLEALEGTHYQEETWTGTED